MAPPIGTVPDNLGNAIPPDKRTARAMVYLLEATRRARQDVSQRASEFRPATNEAHKLKREILRELRRLKDRLDVYQDALSAAPPDGPIPVEVAPLFYKFQPPPVAWDDMLEREYWVPTPDAMTPGMIAAMLGALKEHDDSMKGVFWDYLVQEIASLPGRAGAIIHDAASGFVENAFPRWPIVVGGVVVIGGAMLLASSRK